MIWFDLVACSLRGKLTWYNIIYGVDVYNESLARRSGMVLDFDFDVIDSWNDELNKMNDGKEGVSYTYPESFVQLLGSRVYFHLTYRQTEGVVIAYAGKKHGLFQITIQYIKQPKNRS